jgi:myo-inositol 2-dehydrogenase/D-chiro-inositol 1-dehydrogenase
VAGLVQPGAGSYYQHLDAFIRALNGETVADLPGLVDGLQAQAIAEAAVQSLQRGQFVAVDDCR